MYIFHLELHLALVFYLPPSQIWPQIFPQSQGFGLMGLRVLYLLGQNLVYPKNLFVDLGLSLSTPSHISSGRHNEKCHLSLLGLKLYLLHLSRWSLLPSRFASALCARQVTYLSSLRVHNTIVLISSSFLSSYMSTKHYTSLSVC